MKLTDAGTTLVFSDATPEEKQRLIAAIKPPADTTPATLSRKEAAKIFGVHPGSLKRWEKSGKLRSIKLTARCIRYKKSDVIALLEGSAA